MICATAWIAISLAQLFPLQPPVLIRRTFGAACGWIARLAGKLSQGDRAKRVVKTGPLFPGLALAYVLSGLPLLAHCLRLPQSPPHSRLLPPHGHCYRQPPCG